MSKGLIDIKHPDTIIRTYLLFVHAAYIASKYSDAQFYKKTKLSAIKFTVLGAIAASGGTMKPSEIANWVSRERHNITTLLDRLKREGLVRTRRDSKDRRSINVTITNKGRKVLEQSRLTAKEIVNQVMSSISEEDVAKLEKIAKVLRQNAYNGIVHDTKPTQARYE